MMILTYGTHPNQQKRLQTSYAGNIIDALHAGHRNIDQTVHLSPRAPWEVGLPLGPGSVRSKRHGRIHSTIATICRRRFRISWPARPPRLVCLFIVAIIFVRKVRARCPRSRIWRLGGLLPVLRGACGVVAVLLLVLTIAAGLAGTRDPMMNLAPTLVWVVWWVGLSLVVAMIGNVWPALDPWRTLFEWTDTLARRLVRTRGIVIGWRYPQALGAWPAVVLLLLVAWFEVIYPEGAEPHRIARIALAWSLVTLLGMACFGREPWQRNADVFAVYFGTLGRFAPLAAGPDPRSIELRPPGRGLAREHAGSIAMVGFVIAMLATVLFDGLSGGELWRVVQARISRSIPDTRARARIQHRHAGPFGRVAAFSCSLLDRVSRRGADPPRAIRRASHASVRIQPRADRDRL